MIFCVRYIIFHQTITGAPLSITVMDDTNKLFGEVVRKITAGKVGQKSKSELSELQRLACFYFCRSSGSTEICRKF